MISQGLMFIVQLISALKTVSEQIKLQNWFIMWIANPNPDTPTPYPNKPENRENSKSKLWSNVLLSKMIYRDSSTITEGVLLLLFFVFFTDCVVKWCVTLFNPKPIWDKIVRSFLCLLPCVYFSHLWLSHGLVELIEQADFMSILDIRLCEAKLQFHLTKSWVRLCDFFFFFPNTWYVCDLS